MPDCRAGTQDRPAGVEWESTVFRKVEEAAKADRGLTVERMMELGRVSRSSFYRFDAKDYRDRHRNKCKTMTVTAGEFIRRFMQHALPPGFQRIRHYGLMTYCRRKAKLALCRKLLSIPTAELLPNPTRSPGYWSRAGIRPL